MRVGRVPVLMYHYFSAEPGYVSDDPMVVTAAGLESHLGELDRRGWTPISLSEFVDVHLGRVSPPKKAYLISIDDGHESVARVADQVFRARGTPYSVFLCPGRLGQTATWSEKYRLEPLADAATILTLVGMGGVEVGSHSNSHRLLVGVDASVLVEEVWESRRELELLTGKQVQAFCFPFGEFDRDSLAAVKKSGYDIGLSVSRNSERFAIARVSVKGNESLFCFRFRLSLIFRLASATYHSLLHFFGRLVGGNR